MIAGVIGLPLALYLVYHYTFQCGVKFRPSAVVLKEIWMHDSGGLRLRLARDGARPAGKPPAAAGQPCRTLCF
jgi:hypothetical protein